MKIAVTSMGKDLDSPIDPRFGRARYFLIADTESGDFEIHDNEQNINALRGAGIQSADNVARFGVGALLTGHCGPKAFRALAAAGISIYVGVDGAVKDALERFKNGELKAADSPDVEGHW
jgi:predicted Fe-Mo cluster-binding NifX family protein